MTGAAQLPRVAATVVVAVTLSSPGLGSDVDEGVAVLQSTVPAATDGPTATVRVKTALPPGQRRVRAGDRAAGADRGRGARPAARRGQRDERGARRQRVGGLTAAASLGPAFVTVIV